MIPPEAPRDVLGRIRSHLRVSDSEFDEIYAAPFRALSPSFWTPVDVARRATELLVLGPKTRVLDVGSGVGKFCIVGAAASGARFTGIEHRENLIGEAETAARLLGVREATFRHAPFDVIDPRAFDAIYLFNPFEEEVWGLGPSEHEYALDVDRAERFLSRAALGTRVVTYHGFGGTMPPTYRLALRERQRSGKLELWVKADASTALAVMNPPRSRARDVVGIYDRNPRTPATR